MTKARAAETAMRKRLGYYDKGEALEMVRIEQWNGSNRTLLRIKAFFSS